MKILAMEIEVKGVKPEQFQPHLKEEAEHVWELYQSDVIRELYFRADRSEAVLILECDDLGEAGEALRSLPLVKAGLITFDIVPLVAYPGFARLFGE
jgi:muconolactone delta-isomerase